MRRANGVAGPRVALVVLLIVAVSACADLKVTRVTDQNRSDPSVKGVRYYLPKPFIVFAPQADGTVTANVVYLPDKSHEYAIDTESTWSSYAFQASTDPIGLLTAVQYNADTTAVASQAFASAGAGVAQVMNYEAARSSAVQAQVNTAQGNVIAAQSAYSAALAALNSDNQANITASGTVLPPAIQVDASTVAQKLAALQVAQSALQTAQTTPQAVAGTAAAGAPITTTPAAPGTAFTAPTWGSGLSLNLPERFGPVWYAVNDDGTKASLVAVRASVTGASPTKPADTPSTADAQNLPVTPDPPVAADPQPAFDTTLSALGPPRIAVPTTPFTLASRLPAVFMFNRDVRDVEPVLTHLDNSAVTEATPLWDKKRSIAIDLSKLRAGGYWLNVKFKYPENPAKPDISTTAFQKLLFDVSPK